jgi:hypothetical protein
MPKGLGAKGDLLYASVYRSGENGSCGNRLPFCHLFQTVLYDMKNVIVNFQHTR